MMRDYWSSLREMLVPSRRGPPAGRRDAFWHFFIVVAIVLLAGPDIIASLEMRILLELLGVALFTSVFIAGARLALYQAGNVLREVLVPATPLALLRGAAGHAEKALAGAYFLAHSVWSVAFAIACIAWLHEIFRIVM